MSYLLISHLPQSNFADVRLLFSYLGYGTKKRTLQDKFYIPTFDQDPFEKVKF